MKLTYLPFSLAALSLGLILPTALQAQSGQVDATVPTQSSTFPGTREAMRMVPARASLDGAIDAHKLAPGAQVRITLAHKVVLQDGPELPFGTLLIGQVTSNSTAPDGSQHLALRFNQAVLKSGEIIPVKATITRVYTPGAIEQADSEDYSEYPAQQIPNSWTDNTLAITQLGVSSGVSLHSRVAGQNSGVLISNKKDIKIPSGSEFALAIAAQPPYQPAGNSAVGR
jgi:hypothetical protein